MPNTNQFNVDELLESRASLRGDFKDVAERHHLLSVAIRTHRRHLTPVERLGLDMIAHKIARVVTATRFDEDSWRDIAGYATLVVNNQPTTTEDELQ